MFGKDQLAGLMKQAKQMQKQVMQAQEKLATVEVTGESGAGLVKVTMTAKFKVKRVEIADSLFKVAEGEQLSDQKEMIEDLVAAAFNAAEKKVADITESAMGKFSSALGDIPDGKLF